MYCPASQAMVLAHLKGWQRGGRINGEEYGRDIDGPAEKHPSLSSCCLVPEAEHVLGRANTMCCLFAVSYRHERFFGMMSLTLIRNGTF